MWKELFMTATFAIVAEGQNYVGLAVDAALPTPRLPTHLHPSKIYLAHFNSSDMSEMRVARNWESIEDLLRASKPEGGARGGAAMYAMLQLASALPPGSQVFLITGRAPADTDLMRHASNAIRSNAIQLTVLWHGENGSEGEKFYKDFAQGVGGRFEDDHGIERNVNKLSQVTLVLRQNLTSDTRIAVPVDSSIKDITVLLWGDIQDASLLSPDGQKTPIGISTSKTGGPDATTVPLGSRNRGTWYLETRGHNYGVQVDATSHLAVWTSSKDSKGDTLELWTDANTISRVDDISLVDSVGNQLATLGHSEHANADKLSSTVHIQRRQAGEPHFLQIRATDFNGDQVTRLARIPQARLPTSIEVGLGSMLTAAPGQLAKIYFEVSNNLQIPMAYDYLVNDNYGFIRYLNPRRSVIAPKTTEQVEVALQVPLNQQGQPSQSDIVTFRAEQRNGEYVETKAYFRAGQTNYDSTSPYIYYTYNGDCSNTLSPDNCYIGTWGANVSIIDSTSGLLKITTKPVALLLNSEFVAGTTDYVNGQFTTSCCNTKVEVTATDVLGNKYTRIIDIERKWLNAAEISAIVLGVILLILILAGIIACIVVCCRRRKRTLAIYPDH